ncbi:hypothetical protein [Paenibacillus amylolyticus]|nr:hypothetical protein [Paenibacillus amylolyticus]
MTTDGTDNYFIICHNCGALNYKYYTEQMSSNDPFMYREIFEEEDSMTLRFKIDNVKNGMYKIKVRSVNEEHGNVQQEWINLNMGQDLSNSEIDYLKQIAVPHMRIYQIEVNDETLEFNTELSRNEIKSIRLIYQY